MKPIWYALLSSLVTKAGTSTVIGKSSALVPSGSLARRLKSCTSLWRVCFSMKLRIGSMPSVNAVSALIWPAV